MYRKIRKFWNCSQKVPMLVYIGQGFEEGLSLGTTILQEYASEQLRNKT